MDITEGTMWEIFLVLVLGLLALDLGVFQRRAHVIGLREALLFVGFWIGLALLFGAGIYIWLGPGKALEYITGYLIEYSLSVDNMFVFLLIFSYFAVPSQYQHRVLFWGILGALVMRGIFIVAGVTLITIFHWLVYVFGAFLVLTGVRIFFQEERQVKPEKNPLIRLARRFLPISDAYEGGKFFTVQAGKRLATPMFIVLLAVESTDLVFAVDSIPAILAITRDPFIVYTSNVFAILGLRALYFALAGIMGYFHYLRYGLAVILAFVGVKMLLSDLYEIPVVAALAVVIGILLFSVVLSVLRPRRGHVLPSTVDPMGEGPNPPRDQGPA